MSRQALDELKQQIPLLDYLEDHDWRPVRRLSRGRWMGLCPLHDEHQPSFLVDPAKNLFYCYGCGRGGDGIRSPAHLTITQPDLQREYQRALSHPRHLVPPPPIPPSLTAAHPNLATLLDSLRATQHVLEM